jgi:6-phosphogluconate dehydrogenase
MQIGMIGFGRKGANMARRLMKGAHECVAYDRNAGNVDALVKEGAIGASSLEDVVLDAELPSNELMKRILRDDDL